MKYNLAALGVPLGVHASHTEVTYEYVTSVGIYKVKEMLLSVFSRSSPLDNTSSLIVIDPREKAGMGSHYQDEICAALSMAGMVLVITYSLPLQKQSK
jgi:hypothetical protein